MRYTSKSQIIAKNISLNSMCYVVKVCVWAWYFESLSIKKIDHYLGCRAEGRATNSINQVLLTINKKSILIRNEFYLISNKTQGKWQTSLVHNCHNRIALVSVIGQMHTTDSNDKLPQKPSTHPWAICLFQHTLYPVQSGNNGMPPEDKGIWSQKRWFQWMT